MQRDLVEQQLTPEELQALKNKRTGMFIFQVSWIMAFMCLVMVNWQLSYSREWLPDGTERLSSIPASLASVVLFASLWLAYSAQNAIEADQRQRFMSRWLGSILLGLLFIVVIVYEWVMIEGGSQYAQVFRLMTGFHMFHALVIGAYMLLVYNNARQGMYHALDYWAIEAGVKLWVFVFAAWMLFYTVIYWIAW